MSRAWADDSNDVSHLSISHFKYLLTLFFWAEMSRAWADNSNDVSHLSKSQL